MFTRSLFFFFFFLVICASSAVLGRGCRGCSAILSHWRFPSHSPVAEILPFRTSFSLTTKIPSTVPPFPACPKPAAHGSSSALKPLCDTSDPQCATSWSWFSSKGKASGEKNNWEKLMLSCCPCWDVSFYILSTWREPLGSKSFFFVANENIYRKTGGSHKAWWEPGN